MRSALAKALLLVGRERYNEAVTVLEEAIRASPSGDDALLCTAYQQLAEASALAGDTDKGLAAGRKALAILGHILPGDGSTPEKWERAHVQSALALNHFVRGERAKVFMCLRECRAAGFFGRPRDNAWHGPPGTAAPIASVLYDGALLHVMGRCGIDIEQVLSEAARQPDTQVRHYPDGSVQIDGSGQDFFDAQAFSYAEYMEGLLRADALDITSQRRLDLLSVGFWKDGQAYRYNINSWSDRSAKRGENLVFVVPGRAFEAPPREGDFSCVPVTIGFKARLSEAARSECLEVISAWSQSVRAVGIFGEGPVSVQSKQVTFYPRAAHFLLDVSDSGPHTILWFLLCFLRLSNAAVITKIWFTDHAMRDEGARKELGVDAKKQVRMSLT